MGCSPKAGEGKNEFISRCISTEIKDGVKQDEAQGKCYGIWRNDKTQKAKNILKTAIIKADNIIKEI